MKMEKALKKGLLLAASAILMGMTLFAGETKTYPKDGKGDQILGYKNLSNSYGISTSFEGNKETLLKMFDLIEQTWGLDPKTPGK